MRWTERKNGVMGTFQRRFHVPLEMRRFLQREAGMSARDADDWIQHRWHELTNNWQQMAVTDSGEPTMIHVDHIDSEATEGYAIYDGPEIVTSR